MTAAAGAVGIAEPSPGAGLRLLRAGKGARWALSRSLRGEGAASLLGQQIDEA